MISPREYKLTEKEEKVMQILWEKGPLTVREIVSFYDEPQPHFNTVSTFVHILEDKGFVMREKIPSGLRFHPLVSREDYRCGAVKSMVRRFFDNSCMNVVSSLVQDKSISVDELKQLIDMVEKQNVSKEA